MRSARRRAVTALLAAPLLTALVASCGATDSGTRTMARALPPDAEFTHPGVLVSKAQLDAVRKNVTAGKQPWLKAYLDMRDSKYGSYKYRPEPYENVDCPWGDKPKHGCVEEREDAIAAYTQALLFSVTGKQQHAVKAREIMDAWSAKVKRHTEEDSGLQTGWAGSTWARAGEVIRYSDKGGWPADRVRRFENMLRTVYLPTVTQKVPDYNGNWDLVMTDAAIGIAVFLDDHEAFDHAVQRFRERVPAYFYLEKDGKVPLTPPGSTVNTPQKLTTYWFKQSTYKDGLAQETCRNFKHVGYSIAATAHVAETAWHQGVDLYGEVKDRLKAALAFHARYQAGQPAPAWLCGGKVDRTMGPDLEVVLNHLEDRLDVSVPAAHKLAEETRPAGTDGLFVSWETLTHAGNP
ncbi:alginate lyase family protein [Streptomyces fulvoviolaceus]|uniref:alginate lyase family protein n=1 Tax=Streptomyces fulvoviolaceus TaxID=285535 RepID=UPI0004CA3D8E|nr:alginate lyase family protein [Streptomyces fulvoviolaceus]MCT9083630.1 alginate lyase family protein [Streptomyces fulvoviolaceus]